MTTKKQEELVGAASELDSNVILTQRYTSTIMITIVVGHDLINNKEVAF